MQFPNALEGVKKIYKAEIIALIGAIVGFVAAVLGVAGAQSGNVGGLAGAGVCALYHCLHHEHCRSEQGQARRGEL